MTRQRLSTSSRGGRIALVFVLAASAARAEEPTWRSYRSEPGRFAIEVPATPARADESQPSEVGTIDGSAWTIETAGVVLRIEHYDIPRLGALLLTDHRVLAVAADRMLVDRDGREIERRSYTLAGRSALRVRYTRTDLGETIEEARFVLAGRRLYAAYGREAVPVPRDAGADDPPRPDPAAQARIARFLGSLEIWDAE